MKDSARHEQEGWGQRKTRTGRVGAAQDTNKKGGRFTTKVKVVSLKQRGGRGFYNKEEEGAFTTKRRGIFARQSGGESLHNKEEGNLCTTKRSSHLGYEVGGAVILGGAAGEKFEMKIVVGEHLCWVIGEERYMLFCKERACMQHGPADPQ
jgi:hypothetical protein